MGLITITSSTHKRHPRADMLITTAHLPNPYVVPALRPRDGRDKMVHDWLIAHEEVRAFINQQVQRILTEMPTTITVTCSAGKHRSIMVAEAIAEQLTQHGVNTKVTHRELVKRDRRNDGMGWKHQRVRKRLRANLKDGERCWWCGRPMHREHVLHADHSISRKHGGDMADRLLHGACNEQRQDGTNDHRRPALCRPDSMPLKPIRLKAGGHDERFPTPAGRPQSAPGRPETPQATSKPFAWG